MTISAPFAVLEAYRSLIFFHFYFIILTLLLSLPLVTGSHQLLLGFLYETLGCLLTFHATNRSPGAAPSHVPDSCISYHYSLPFLAMQGSPRSYVRHARHQSCTTTALAGGPGEAGWPSDHLFVQQRPGCPGPSLLAQVHASTQGAGLDPLSSSLRKTH